MRKRKAKAIENVGRSAKAYEGLRPSSLSEFAGQQKVKDNLAVFIGAAKRRKEPLDHVLFAGPPGLGKTTLASIIASEFGVEMKTTSGPMLEKQKDLASILTNLSEGSLLFIDEIHRLPNAVEEALYPAMEEFNLDIVVGSGSDAQVLKLPVPHFTLIGATTRSGMLTAPFRERFGMHFRLELYSEAELTTIIIRASGFFGISIEKDAARDIARRSRGTPRMAIRILKRVRDFAEAGDKTVIDAACVDNALSAMDIDHCGINENDKRFMLVIIEKFRGGPVGIGSVAAALDEDRQTIENMESYLLQQGFIERTPKGRIATPKAYEHFGIPLSTAMLESKYEAAGRLDESVELGSPGSNKSPVHLVRSDKTLTSTKSLLRASGFYCARVQEVTNYVPDCPRIKNEITLAPECILCKVKHQAAVNA